LLRILIQAPVQTSTSSRSGTTIYNAERVEVVRAALAAGADRYTVNTASSDIVDYRLDEENQSDNGLDIRYGTGQLNIYQSYYIIAPSAFDIGISLSYAEAYINMEKRK
jgi:hypothetical protein